MRRHVAKVDWAVKRRSCWKAGTAQPPFVTFTDSRPLAIIRASLCPSFLVS